MATTDTYQSVTPHMMRSPAADRNKEALVEVLRKITPTDGNQLKGLEIASGTGQHVTYFSKELPHISWQPSECDKKSLQSIAGYIESTGAGNVSPALFIDTTEETNKWGGGSLEASSWDLMLCVNMIHISPWAATEGLFRGAGYFLKPGAILATYGPFAIHGEITPDSNVQFDSMLRQQNAEWGLRDTDELEKLAGKNGLALEERFPMPANNYTLVFRKL